MDGQALETARELLDVGSDVNLPDRGSLWTPLLRCAATHGNADVARLLLKKGANVNQKDRDGKVRDARTTSNDLLFIIYSIQYTRTVR